MLLRGLRCRLDNVNTNMTEEEIHRDDGLIEPFKVSWTLTRKVTL